MTPTKRSFRSWAHIPLSRYAPFRKEETIVPIPVFLICDRDNVVTLLSHGTRMDLADAAGTAIRLTLLDDIPLHHKAALRDIPAGAPVVKYGVVIGEATEDIAAGSWVHLHNVRSLADEKSSTLDLHTGTDTKRRYE